jgi:hypothetical protein
MGDWIKRRGGERPIKSDKTVFQMKFRCEIDSQNFFTLAMGHDLEWGHRLCFDDIIAYRIVEDHEPKDEPVVSRAEIEAEIAKLQAKLDVMPIVDVMYWNGSSVSFDAFPYSSHTFDIITINGVPHINGVAMKVIEK